MLGFLVVELPWPTGSRELIFESRTWLSSKGKDVMIDVKLSENATQPTSGHTKVNSLRVRWMVTPLKKGRTKIYYFNDTDPGVSGPDGMKRKLSWESHRDTLKSMNNLALVLAKQGRYKKSRELSEKCLSLRTANLGDDHPDTFCSMEDLATLYQYQGEFDNMVKNLTIS